MLTLAYLANTFPVSVEPYVGWEVEELRRRGIQVIPGSVAKPACAEASANQPSPSLHLRPLRGLILLRALALALRRGNRISSLITRICFAGTEPPQLRLKALLHTALGAYYACLLQHLEVDHIHAHHGYFGSWIAMVAARLLNVTFSLTLHGSDLLLDASYLDTKLANCKFCVTISEYNRRYLLDRYPTVDGRKIMVSRLGVEIENPSPVAPAVVRKTGSKLCLLAVGRLHAVKNHTFLVRACLQLRHSGSDFECWIAGEGPERRKLEAMIVKHKMEQHLKLLGHLAPPARDSLYRQADIVVLTSHSEGIPLVLMEAMARGRLVLAPAITGIPEIVIPGKTGFLYMAGSLEDFLAKIRALHEQISSERKCAVSRLDWVRHAGRAQVFHNFDRRKNLMRFADQFLLRIATLDSANQNWRPCDEDPILQQVQLPF